MSKTEAVTTHWVISAANSTSFLNNLCSILTHAPQLYFKFGFLWQARFCRDMELGSLSDPTQSTFALIDEVHTFSNAVRYTLNQDPRTNFCGYSIPHPSDNRVNIRIQTTGDPAKDVFKDACQDLMVMCQHVSNTFDKALIDFKMSNTVEGMNIESDS